MLAQISWNISNVYTILSTSLISKYLQKSVKYLRVELLTHLLEPSPTSTSNPFLCAADFFLQLGSCKEAVR